MQKQGRKPSKQSSAVTIFAPTLFTTGNQTRESRDENCRYLKESWAEDKLSQVNGDHTLNLTGPHDSMSGHPSPPPPLQFSRKNNFFFWIQQQPAVAGTTF